MLLGALREEHKPSALTETILVDKMAQALWLTKRAVLLQHFQHQLPGCSDPKRLALYLRYETTHDRIFHKCLNELLKLKAEKRKAASIQRFARRSQNRSPGFTEYEPATLNGSGVQQRNGLHGGPDSRLSERFLFKSFILSPERSEWFPTFATHWPL